MRRTDARSRHHSVLFIFGGKQAPKGALVQVWLPRDGWLAVVSSVSLQGAGGGGGTVFPQPGFALEQAFACSGRGAGSCDSEARFRFAFVLFLCQFDHHARHVFLQEFLESW